ncbi:amidohydrolase family protein [Streptomyces sp. NPDC050560]|uniref:amidohydrolase family protein n=1 Tax=Streptomyces sp. NPDC050560 TaxID=3365630 RepID=UPI0037A001C6
MPHPGPLLLHDITVVDTHDGTPHPHQDVHTADGTITRVTPTAPAPPASDGVTVVPGRGRFLVPGYLDMHAHPLGDGDPSGTLALMLAHGITGFRQMAGSPELLAARRAGTLPAPADGPAPLAIPGVPLRTPLNARDEETVTATVRAQHAQGADFIKVGDTTPAVFTAALTEANRLGIPLLGHLPAGVDIRAAARGGLRCVEHLGPGIALLAACCTDEAGIRTAVERQLAAAAARPVPQLDARMIAHLRSLVTNPLLGRGDGDVALLRRATETFDEARARDLAALLAATETWQCPTLVRAHTTQFADAPEYRDDPDHRYMAPGALDTWRCAADTYAARPPEERAVHRAVYELQLRLVRVFDEAGVPMLAGSDACGAGWEVPGAALHREFDELAGAGLSPLRVLQMTTLLGARFLGVEDRLGSVAEGRAADLVLLDADPLADVRHLHAVSGVVRAGRHLDARALAHIRDHVATTHSAA